MENDINELLRSPFSTKNYADKLRIVQGKPRPSLPSLVSTHKDKKNEYVRHFSESHYDAIEWLTGCKIRFKLFCWPCLLFSTEKRVGNQQGYTDLNHLPAALQKHEKSRAHVQSSLSLKMFGKQRIETLVDTQRKAEISRHNEQVKKNREILKRLIDAVCYLAKQELPFRGHDESNTSDDKGNYKEFLNTLRDYDTCLDSHLNTATVFQRTSPTVQNDLIQALSNVLKKHIKKEIDSARFVAIILDETSDVMSKSQLSTVLRFVCNGKVFERFIGFSDVSADRTADGLFSHVVDIAKEFEIENKLVGQMYDGASVMSGPHEWIAEKSVG
ncbi:zinc finger MYM-type protein 1-like [Tachypleus tridentatus]|uniref:zinc finger MYM-type protein 1-like n=1 Tax=Tachypleus tridentatus TaxID=6853 RepID=UPI003FD5EF66